MGDKLKTLIEDSGQEDEFQEKFAEEAIAWGQLAGRGFNYEVFEKNGAPFAKLVKGLKGAGKAIAGGSKEITSRAHKKITGFGQKINLKTKLYKPGKAGKKRDILTGYSILGAGAAGAAGGGALLRKTLKSKKSESKEASEKVASLSDYILRYE